MKSFEKKNLFLTGVSLFFLLFSLITSGETPHFDLSTEFPRYFLPTEHRETPADDIPREVVANAKSQLEKTTFSLLKRLVIPIVPEGTQEPQLVRYFDYMDQELKKIDPHVKILPSGGVVRSVIGYIYSEIKKGALKAPPVSAEQTLRNLEISTNDILGHVIRGVGSDFDILLKHSGTHFKDLESTATRITNSSETAYQLRDMQGALKRSLFTVGDVKDYDEQTNRSVEQGGSAIDLLAFDMETGQFVEPAGLGSIVSNLIRGHYEYLNPQEGKEAEVAAKQTIRGIRPLVELPFLSLKDEKLLREELKQLQKAVEEGELDSVEADKMLEQFDKTVRNARFSGAHNRLYRGKNGSLETLILAVARTIEEHYDRSTIPEFVDTFPLEGRDTSTALNGLPEELLTNQQDFMETHTDNGTLYHGCSHLEQGLAIMRGGLFVSKKGGRILGSQHTTALFNRGGYASDQKDTAQNYATESGLVFELKVADGYDLNILDWEKVKNHPTIQAIEKQAQSEGRDVFEYLAREHGIDIIIHQHILIQNMSAIEVPNSFKGLVNSFGTIFQNPNVSLENKVKAYDHYQRMYNYALALGEKEIQKPPSPQSLWEHIKQETSYIWYAYLIAQKSPLLASLGLSKEEVKQVEEEIIDSITHDREDFPSHHASHAAQTIPLNPEAHKKIADIAESGENENSRENAINALRELQKGHPEHSQLLRKISTEKSESPDLRTAAIRALSESLLYDPKSVDTIAHLAHHSEEQDIRAEALSALIDWSPEEFQKTPAYKEACLAGFENEDIEKNHVLHKKTIQALGKLRTDPQVTSTLVKRLQVGTPLTSTQFHEIVLALGYKVATPETLDIVLSIVSKTLDSAVNMHKITYLGEIIAQYTPTSHLNKLDVFFETEATHFDYYERENFAKGLTLGLAKKDIGTPPLVVYAFLKKHQAFRRYLKKDEMLKIINPLLKNIHVSQVFDQLFDLLLETHSNSSNNLPDNFGEALLKNNVFPLVVQHFSKITQKDIDENWSITKLHENILREIILKGDVVENSHLKDFLVSLIKNYPSESIKEQALIALAPAFDLKEVQDLALSFLENEDMNQAATAALTQATELRKVADSFLDELSQNPHQNIRRAAHLALRKHPNQQKLIDSAESLIESDPELKRTGMMTIRSLYTEGYPNDIELKDLSLRPRLKKLLLRALELTDDPFTADWALGALSNQGDVEELVSLTFNDVDEVVEHSNNPNQTPHQKAEAFRLLQRHHPTECNAHLVALATKATEKQKAD